MAKSIGVVREKTLLRNIRTPPRGKTDGLIDPVVMKAITDREVAAGRMVENDDLRNLAASYVAVTTPEDTPKKSGGLLAGIKSWFR
jgi:hypothetical protein